MKKETVKLNKSALCFTDITGTVKMSEPKEGTERNLYMVAYSGGVITDHWYWGNLVIDVEGMKISGNLPILKDHNSDQKIGFGKFKTDNYKIVPTSTKFLDTEFANEFLSLSDQGFPFQASVYAKPSKIQRLMDNEEVDVNGFKFKGPGTVWRESVLKECSIVTFGADPNTKSVAMSENEDVEMFVEMKTIKEDNEEVIMNLDKLKGEHSELYAQVLALGKSEAESSFAEVKSALEAQITTLTTDKMKLSEQNADSETRLLKLEKAEVLRQEESIRFSADSIVAAKLGKSSIPERLHPKVRKQLNH